MWKPECVLPDGSEVTLPESIQTDEQAAFFYGGLAFAVLQDINEGNLSGIEQDRATALGMEIAGQYGQGDTVGMAFAVAAMDSALSDIETNDGAPVFGKDDSHHVRHSKVHKARRRAA